MRILKRSFLFSPQIGPDDIFKPPPPSLTPFPSYSSFWTHPNHFINLRRGGGGREEGILALSLFLEWDEIDHAGTYYKDPFLPSLWIPAQHVIWVRFSYSRFEKREGNWDLFSDSWDVSSIHFCWPSFSPSFPLFLSFSISCLFWYTLSGFALYYIEFFDRVRFRKIQLLRIIFFPLLWDS